MFWVLAACLVGLVALPLLLPLARSAQALTDAGGHDRAFYQSQLAEIDRQGSLGLIGAAEAEAARAEAARRLLQVAEVDGDGDQVAQTVFGRRAASIAILIALPVIGIGAYLAKGAPSMPSHAFASRSVMVQTPDGSIDILAAVRQIEQHLQRNPDDGRGYEVVGPIYMRMGRHEDAVRAFRESLRLNGPSASRHFVLGEAIVFENKGAVIASARGLFEQVIASEPTHSGATLFLAMADEQVGNRTQALARLTDLLPRLPEGSLKTEVARQITELGGVPKGGKAIVALPADQQLEVIRSMVDGLASRLAQTGGPAADWARLIRALGVLGETDRAHAILAEARQKFASIPADNALIEAAAESLK
jgi:cytochrome c-type biogenesis protein CcmH